MAIKIQGVRTSLFVAETEQFIGSNLNLIEKIDMLKIGSTEKEEMGEGK